VPKLIFVLSKDTADEFNFIRLTIHGLRFS
jgi:hypothetical protein